MELTVVHDAPTEREAVPLLLDALYDRNPDKAAWIEDVYSEVLKDLRHGTLKDKEMGKWLMEALTHGFQAVAPEGHYFTHEGDTYGYVCLDTVMPA